MTHCIIRTEPEGITKLRTEYEATKCWLRWLCWVWTQLPKPEYNVQASSTWVGLTLKACWSFNNFRETFPEVPSGTGNFPKVVRVILKEARVFSQFPLWSISSWHCSNYFSLELIASLVTTTTRLTIRSTAHGHIVSHFLIVWFPDTYFLDN